MEQSIRYEFLKDWVLNATVDEIVGKLIELDNLKKEYQKNTRIKKTIEKLELALENDKLKAMTSWDRTKYNRLEGMGDAYKLIKLLIDTNYKVYVQP